MDGTRAFVTGALNPFGRDAFSQALGLDEPVVGPGEPTQPPPSAAPPGGSTTEEPGP